MRSEKKTNRKTAKLNVNDDFVKEFKNLYREEIDAEVIIKRISRRILNDVSRNVNDSIEPHESIFVFSEENYTSDDVDEERKEFLNKVPTPEEVYDFLDCFYIILDVDICCIISAYIYLLRLMDETRSQLHKTNWRPLYFVSLLIANKFLCDNYLKLEDFFSSYPFFTQMQLAKLESSFLSIIKWRLYLSDKEYFNEVLNLLPESDKPYLTKSKSSQMLKLEFDL